DEPGSHLESRGLERAKRVMVGEYDDAVASCGRVRRIHEGVRELAHVRVVAPDGIPFILSKLDKLECRALPGIPDVAFVGNAKDADYRVSHAGKQTTDDVQEIIRHGVVDFPRR